MPDPRRLEDGEPRAPTFLERLTADNLRASGVADVWRPVADAPVEFWNALLQAVDWNCLALDFQSYDKSTAVTEWQRELRWSWGLDPDFRWSGREVKAMLVGASLPAPEKLTMVELLLDVVRPPWEFTQRVNEAAERWRVGIRLDGRRFVVIESQELHETILRPALTLLRSQDLAGVDEAYRKACDRLLAGDWSGCITAVSTAIEEAFRAGGAKGTNLQGLARSALAMNWIGPGVRGQIEKLEAFRDESDAHKVGTDDQHLAMLVLHIGGSILLYLGQSGPFLEGSRQGH